jgi:hypothetical protein
MSSSHIVLITGKDLATPEDGPKPNKGEPNEVNN